MSERGLWRAMTCALEFRQIRQRSSTSGPVRWIDETIQELNDELETMSRSRQSEGTDPSDLNHDNEKRIGSREMSQLIGWNIRRVQRCYKQLGGEMVRGRIEFKESVVYEQIEGSAA